MESPSNTMQNAVQIFEYLYTHAGIPVLIGVGVYIYKATKWITEKAAVATKAVNQLDTLATNHFPHMEESLKNQDGLMHSMDNSLKILVERTPEPHRKK
jgi:hypothetical protein